MPESKRNDPCHCGSGRKFKNCHGSPNPPPRPHTLPPQEPQEPGAIDNPFKRIFAADGTVNQEYVMTRLKHLEGLLRANEAFFPLRYDRVRLETILAERQDLFEGSDSQEGFEAAFHRFAEVALDQLVTKEFDQKAKETLKTALHDSDLTQRDRAAAACALVLTLPEEGDAPQRHHENPFFDLVLRVTFNESMARVDFLQKLHEDTEISDTEREARFQEFLRSVPALLFEIQEGFRNHVQKALESYHRGDFSFGIGLDMILHGLRTVRKLTEEYESVGEGERSEEETRLFSERFGAEMQSAFADDIGEDEERELLARMGGLLETARAAKEKKAAKGLSSALEVMAHNPEVRQRMLFAGYHEAVSGNRIYREEGEAETARPLFTDPAHLDPYLEYGRYLESEGYTVRAERVYRAALEFFPDEDVVRERLAAVAETLEPSRIAEIQERIKEIEAEEAEVEAVEPVEPGGEVEEKPEEASEPPDA